MRWKPARGRYYVMSLGYLQAPVVIAGDQHWSGFRPDAIKLVSAQAASHRRAAAVNS